VVSQRISCAATAAHKQEMTVLAITGERQSRLAGDADIALRVPLSDTATIQEMHMLFTHILCDIVEQALMYWDGEV
jgi:D-sedoheptulose 7-phosphate isomerase